MSRKLAPKEIKVIAQDPNLTFRYILALCRGKGVDLADVTAYLQGDKTAMEKYTAIELDPDNWRAVQPADEPKRILDDK